MSNRFGEACRYGLDLDDFDWIVRDDQFFDLLSIPELTSPAAAKAKNLAGPLILKRDGCHAWHPEHFPEEDPRHGWTWHDCRQDALTLLGNEIRPKKKRRRK